MQIKAISEEGRSQAITQSTVFIQVLWITVFAALTALGARVEIAQYPVPFTLQTFFVLLAGAFLGARNGAISQLLYLGVGAIGLPVFAAVGAPGFLRLIGPTGGYLFAFPIAAYLVGYLVARRGEFIWILFSMFAGLLVIFSLGTIQLNFVVFQDLRQAIKSGFLIFSWWDLLKLAAAASIYHRIAGRSKK